MTQHLTLIDGSGFIFRAYHVLPPMTNSEGTPVAAVYGFTNMLLKFLEGHKTDYIAVVFDASRHTFRNRLYDQYKANRPEAPEDLVPQFPLVREAAKALNLPVIELQDYEADDIIATYAKEASARGIATTIVSSDKDLMQLIKDGVAMYDPMKQKPIGVAEVQEKFGVMPDKVCDVLALIGDSSDNVPGVPGIGPKTAAELITQYGDLETLLSRANEIKQPKRRDVVLANLEQARLSHKLVCLDDNVPLPLAFEQLDLKKPEQETLLAFMQKHGFRSLIARMKLPAGAVSAPAQPMPQTASAAPLPTRPAQEYRLIQDEAVLAQWLAEARAKGVLAFDIETNSLNAMQAALVGFSIAMEPGKAAYVPVGHRESGIENRESGAESKKKQETEEGWDAGTLFASSDSRCPLPASLLPGQIPQARALELLKPILEDPSILKIGQNIKYDMLVMRRYGIDIAPIDDSMLLSYSVNGGLHGHGMDELAQKYLGVSTITYDQVTKPEGGRKARICFSEVALEPAMQYAAEDADITLQLHHILKPRVAEAQALTLYETIERPLVPVLVAMEARGIKVDKNVLSSLSQDFSAKMLVLEQEIYKHAGRSFNIGSPKQLGEILFDELSLGGGKKSSKTGAYSTDSYVLEELAETGHPLPQLIIDWRQLSKLKSTYTDSLQQQIDSNTGRVHTSYAMAIAATGRLSSTDPNLQNIPIRTEEGRKIRHAFVSEPGNKLISADYSQIELRLLAHVADIGPLKEAFKNGLDIHAATASQMFGVPVQEVSGDLRRNAKMINFGIIYGMSAHGLAVRLGIPRGEAAAYIEQYFRQYPGIRDYMEFTKETARRQGYVTTLYGRRVHTPMILDKNPARRQFSERAAINAPLQGTAADIIKRAMIAVEKTLSHSATAAKMLLQVHDELVFEVPEAHAQETLALIKPAMEKAAHLSVPLLVEAGVGNNWGEIH